MKYTARIVSPKGDEIRHSNIARIVFIDPDSHGDLRPNVADGDVLLINMKAALSVRISQP